MNENVRQKEGKALRPWCEDSLLLKSSYLVSGRTRTGLEIQRSSEETKVSPSQRDEQRRAYTSR